MKINSVSLIHEFETEYYQSFFGSLNRHANLNFKYRSNTIKKKKNMRKTWQDQAYTFLRERVEFNERKRQMVWQGKHRPIKMF